MLGCPRCRDGISAGVSFCPGCGRALQPYGTATANRQLTPAEQRALRAATTGTPWLWVVGTFAVVLLAVAIAALTFAVTRSLANDCVSGGCPPARLAPPVPPSDPYVSTAYGFQLDAASHRCPEDMRVRERGDAWIEWTVTGESVAGEWPVRVEAEPAEGRSAEEMVTAYQARTHSDAEPAYVIPRAHLGFHPGHGAVYDLTQLSASGAPLQTRLIVMAAVHDELAVTLAALGPLDTRQYAHPNPARTSIVICFTDMTNTITWPGDDPF